MASCNKLAVFPNDLSGECILGNGPSASRLFGKSAYRFFINFFEV